MLPISTRLPNKKLKMTANSVVLPISPLFEVTQYEIATIATTPKKPAIKIQ